MARPALIDKTRRMSGQQIHSLRAHGSSMIGHVELPRD